MAVIGLRAEAAVGEAAGARKRSKALDDKERKGGGHGKVKVGPSCCPISIRSAK